MNPYKIPLPLNSTQVVCTVSKELCSGSGFDSILSSTCTKNKNPFFVPDQIKHLYVFFFNCLYLVSKYLYCWSRKNFLVSFLIFVVISNLSLLHTPKGNVSFYQCCVSKYLLFGSGCFVLPNLDPDPRAMKFRFTWFHYQF